MRGGSFADKLLYTLAMKAVSGEASQGRSSEIEKATAGMVRLMSLQLQMQQTELASRLKLMDRENHERSRDGNSTLETIKMAFEMAKTAMPKQVNGSGSSNGKFEDFVGAMNIGLQLAEVMRGKKTDEEWFRDYVLPLVQELGPGIIGIVAMILPKDKGKLIIDLMEQHMKTRAAEADGEPDVVDTVGNEVHK